MWQLTGFSRKPHLILRRAISNSSLTRFGSLDLQLAGIDQLFYFGPGSLLQ